MLSAGLRWIWFLGAGSTVLWREGPGFAAAAGLPPAQNLLGAGGLGDGEEKAGTFWFFLALLGTEVEWLW